MQKVKGRIRVQYRKPDGVRASAWFNSKADAKDFQSKLDNTKKRMAVGLAAPMEKILFIDAFSEWLEKRRLMTEQGIGAYSSWVGEESKGRRVWVPELGMYPLSSVTKGDCIKILDGVFFGQIGEPAKGRKKRPTSAATRNRHLAMISKFFEDQIDLGRMEFNPAERIPMLSEEKKTRKLIPLTPAQAALYLQTAEDLNPSYAMLAKVMLMSGSRISETIALTVKSFDLQNNIIIVNRTLEIVSGKVVERTKGKRSGGSHCPALFPPLRDAVVAWVKSGQAGDNFLVEHPSKPGKNFSYWMAENLHQAILKQAGLPDITIHDLRRTHSKLITDGGFNTRELQQMLGHSSVAVTERYLGKDPGHLLKRGEEINVAQVFALKRKEAVNA